MEIGDIVELCSSLSIKEGDGSVNVLGEGLDIARMKFDRVAFWIQIHNVPLLCMTKDIGAYLGGLIGEVQDVDLGASGDCLGKFLRVQVFVDANKPLKHLLRVDLAGTYEITVMVLRYERLSDFCCKCGLIGHVARECPAAGTSAASSSSAGLEFGLWLRATSPSRSVGVGFRHDTIPLSNQNSGRGVGGVSASVNRDLLASSRGVPSGEVQVVKPSDAAGLGGISESNLQVQTMVAGAVTPSVTAGLGENNDSGLQVQTMAVSAVTGDCCDNSVAGGKKGLVLCDGAVVGSVERSVAPVNTVVPGRDLLEAAVESFLVKIRQ
ncbi:hypothetical protein ACOSQ3_014360 [Xanthoceras sorbifolium]